MSRKTLTWICSNIFIDPRSSFVLVKSSLKYLLIISSQFLSWTREELRRMTRHDGLVEVVLEATDFTYRWGLRNKINAMIAQSEMVASLPICIILKRFFKMQVIFVSLKKLPNSDPIFAFDFSLSLWISLIDLGFSQSFWSVSCWLDAFSGMTNVSNRKTDGSNNAGLSLSASSRAFVCRITALLQVSINFFNLFYSGYHLDLSSSHYYSWNYRNFPNDMHFESCKATYGTKHFWSDTFLNLK